MDCREVAKFLLSFAAFVLFVQTPVHAVKKNYVVYLGAHSHGPHATAADFHRVTEHHHHLLETLLGSKERAQDAVIYSYTKHINGFAAKLEEDEALAISKRPDVISVFLDEGLKLHTTRSWEFMGLEKDGRVPDGSIWAKSNYGKDVIIANIDGGVWPELKSFNDRGLGPVPSKWKGSCQNNTKEGVPCNRKLIGAKYYKESFEAALGHPINHTFVSARDAMGHGSHTLSTAAGGFVAGANYFALANGTAKGGSPGARAAVYKACWPPHATATGECYIGDIVAAMDAAIEDGVEVVSISLGGPPQRYDEDGVALSSFHAVMKGIPVVMSAGNEGPTPASVSNAAPWIITVAASTLDRSFSTSLELGNRQHYQGVSFSSDSLLRKMYPLISSADAAIDDVDAAFYCDSDSLDPTKVKGKIVACLTDGYDNIDKGLTVREAGGVGMILSNDDDSIDYATSAEPHLLPAIHVTNSVGSEIYSYINSTQFPRAYIGHTETVLGKKPAPVMAIFSSPGPNIITPDILKPDITAPGVDILAGFSQAASPSGNPSDARRSQFQMMSGTSMSCPHVAGVVGLLKTLHPDWTPSAIRSAIMTTAGTEDNAGQPISKGTSKGTNTSTKALPFDYGAGHLRPNLAMDPGLVYDLTLNDYLDFICALGYNSTAWDPKGQHKCPPKNITLSDFNYPSITVRGLKDSVTVSRRVKNVGPPSSTYIASCQPPKGVSISIHPKILEFEKIGEEKTFKLSMSLKNGPLPNYSFGKLIWSDGKHYVRSQIVVSSNDPY